MTDEVIDALASSRIPLVPTLLLLANLADWGNLCGAPAGQRDGCRRMLEKTADTLHRAHKAGVVFVSGTDSGFAVTPYGDWHAREMELLMVYAGLSSAEALASMTSNAAKTVGGEGRVGEIAEGMQADVLIVNGDPIKNIRVLVDKRNIETVIKAGRVAEFDEEELAIRRAHEEVIAYSTGELTYETIYGDGPPDDRPAIRWDVERANDLLSDLGGRKRLDPRAVVDA